MSDEFETLCERVSAGVANRWPNASKDVQDRIVFELDQFKACGRVPYCLMALGVVDAIRKAGGIVGPGRGACASSAVLYALGITNVDPLKHGLMFEIFMTPEKKSPVPILIDTDAIGERAARAYLVAAYGSLQDLSRRTYAPQLISVNGWEIGITRTDALDRLAEMVRLVGENGGPAIDVWNLPPNDPSTVAAFARGDTSGLQWFDGPVVRGTLSRARMEEGDFFAKLCLCGAISYPGLMPAQEEVLLRISGESKAEALHPLLEEVCEETMGLVVYQEQIVRAVRLMAGFTRSEADVCRKSMARLKLDQLMSFREKFVAGCLANLDFRTGKCVDESVAKGTATEIWNVLERNGRFAYMKSHMVCAATTAYQLGYLRSHHLAEWLYLDGKQVPQAVKRTVARKMDLNHLHYALMEGCRVTLLMRHAERPPLESGDTSFGARLALTERGVETAHRFGASLPGELQTGSVRLYAGNTLRTIQTAVCVGESLENAQRSVQLVAELGSDSPFFGKLDERMALISEGNYRERLNDYFRIGTQRGYNPLAGATDKMEAALERLATGDKALVIAVTHDINVAAFLAGRGVVAEFDEALWPHYLDAAAIIRNDEGEVEYGYLRFNPARTDSLCARTGRSFAIPTLRPSS